MRDTHFHTVTVRLPAPGISSAGVEPVRGAASVGTGVPVPDARTAGAGS